MYKSIGRGMLACTRAWVEVQRLCLVKNVLLEASLNLSAEVIEGVHVIIAIKMGLVSGF